MEELVIWTPGSEKVCLKCGLAIIACNNGVMSLETVVEGVVSDERASVIWAIVSGNWCRGSGLG